MLNHTEETYEKAHNLEKLISRSNPDLEDLSQKDREFAKQLAAVDQDFVVDNLPRLLYREGPDGEPVRPPTIEEFLTPEWIGFSANTIFPIWRRDLTETIFGPHSTIKEIIFAGATGCGKTTIARYCLLYNAVRVAYFRCPQLIFGVDPATILSNIMISVDLKKAGRALMDPLIALLHNGPRFIRVGKKDSPDDVPISDGIGYQESDGVKMSNNIVFYCGSQPSHAISESLMGAMLDEAEFRRDADAVTQALSFYLTLKERLENRFEDIPWTILSLVSSAKSTEGVIPNYIESVKEGSKTTKVFAYAVWDVRKFDSYDQGHFYVLKGNRITPSRLLSEEEEKQHEAGTFEEPRNCKIIKVPEAHRENFERDIDRALMNTAGEVVNDVLLVFDNLECFKKPALNRAGELYLTADFEVDNRLVDQMPKEMFTVFSGENKYLKRAPNALRYVHIDLAEVSEAGLTASHKELGDHGEILYVGDFTLKITSPTRIDIEAVQKFLIDLHEEFNVQFGLITADQYQSSQMLQGLKKLKYPVERLSVDRTPEAYYRASAQSNSNHVRIGACPKLLEQVEAVREVDGKIVTRLRKDMADSFVGSVFNAVNDVKAEPVYTFSHESSKDGIAVYRKEDKVDLEEIP